MPKSIFSVRPLATEMAANTAAVPSTTNVRNQKKIWMTTGTTILRNVR